VRHFHTADQHDPRLYELMIDATGFTVDTRLDLIVKAAEALPDNEHRAGAVTSG
jgi:hypothetical protein